ncbi:MAG: histone deacetylase [Desulfobulbus sp.]|jgi:acetoin utilization deacetylase AcuC-like enzyme
MDTLLPVTIVTDSACIQHDTGGNDHPEAPERMGVISEQIARGALGDRIRLVLPRPATREQLLSFHTEDWLFRFEEAVLSGRTYIDHPDNQVGYESFTIARLSAGGGIAGVDEIEARPGSVVFTQTRPPGHHSEPNQPYGFCFFNNCVIAARYWQQQYNRRRVCVFDFDAHHGNGIQTAFEEDPEAAYVSIHEHPSFSYPGTGWAEEKGIGPGKGRICNLPLVPGAGDAQARRFLPRIREFLDHVQPDALIVAAGFDAHRLDDMSGLGFSTDMYRELGGFVMKLAHEYTEGRLLSILEGGYCLEILGESVDAYLTGLAEAADPEHTAIRGRE